MDCTGCLFGTPARRSVVSQFHLVSPCLLRNLRPSFVAISLCSHRTPPPPMMDRRRWMTVHWSSHQVKTSTFHALTSSRPSPLGARGNVYVCLLCQRQISFPMMNRRAFLKIIHMTRSSTPKTRQRHRMSILVSSMTLVIIWIYSDIIRRCEHQHK